MKKIFKILSIAAIGAVSLGSCQRDLTSLNEDPKHATSLPSENLLASQMYYTANAMFSPSVNGNNYRFFTQQLAETTYVDETNYDLVTRNQPRGYFNTMYTSGINNIRLAKDALAKEANSPALAANKWATLELQEIFVWENLVDTYGNIPYSEAFDSEKTLSPKYDDAATIYTDLLKRIDAAVAKIDKSAGGYTKGGDLVYFGDMSRWAKFGNSLKLRMAMNLADVNPALSKSTAEAAVKSGVMSSNADSYIFKFDTGTFSNPVYDNFIASGRNDFVPTELVINMMNERNDPRREQWFTTVNGKYIGGVFGTTNSFAYFSHYSDKLTARDAGANLLSYTEVLFLKAEGEARGYDMGGTAEEFYKDAITASMQEAGVAAADVQTYLAANPFNAANWKKSIGEEAYIALFDKAFAAWNFSRRLDYPVFVNPDDSLLTGVPVRMPYSSQEYQLNGTNVKAAATAIGGDLATTKLFWDKN